MKKMLLGLAAVGLITLSAGNALAGDKCKDFTVKFKNNATTTVKVTKVEYYDYDDNKWRSESLTSSKINAGQTWNWKRNFEHIGGDKTKFRVTYKKQIGGTKWTDDQTKVSVELTCKDNGSKVVTLP